MAGRHLLFNKPVTPEPLVKPTREGQRIDKTVDAPSPAANDDTMEDAIPAE
jgi:CPA2 family monovalent cation:H+ antiporter-2